MCDVTWGITNGMWLLVARHLRPVKSKVELQQPLVPLHQGQFLKG